MDYYRTEPLISDTDSDGYTDGEEINIGTDPNDPNSFPVDDDIFLKTRSCRLLFETVQPYSYPTIRRVQPFNLSQPK